MSKLSFLNQTTFRIYTYKYKAFVTPCLIIFVCGILFLFFIIPQAQVWLTMQQQIVISEQHVNVLTNNLTFANKINGNVIDKYLQLVSRALPINKDFIGILAGISNASIDSGVSLNDYSFAVGDLQGDTKDAIGNMEVVITINGGLNDADRFAVSLKKQLPLSDITEIHVDSNTLASVTINFYYKPFPGSVTFQPSKPLQALTNQEQSLLEKLIILDSSARKSSLSIQQRLIDQ